MRASQDHCREESAKFGVGRADAGGAIVFLQVLPDLLDSSEVGDGNLNGWGEAQGNITERLLIVLVPGVPVLVRRMTAMWVALITHSRIISNRWYVPCSPYQTCLVRDTV